MNQSELQDGLSRLQKEYAESRVIPVIDEVFGKSGYERAAVGESDSFSCGIPGIKVTYEKEGKPRAYVTIHFANYLVSLWLDVEGSKKKYSNLSYNENSTGFVEKSARLAWADVIERPWKMDEWSHQHDKKWED
jgi:hypothetical protein